MTVSYKKCKGQGAGDYYLDCSDSRTTVRAREHGDYYTNDAKEPPGVWYSGPKNGERKTSLGYKHGNKFDQKKDSVKLFKNLCQGFNKAGKALTQNSGDENRVGLHDWTLSAPKSVSVAWAFGADETKKKIQDAQQAASVYSLDFLSQYSITRTGKGGKDKVHAPLRGALFEHASSRENDPQLHTHCVVFNVVEKDAEKTGALETRHIMKWTGAAASLYHADLAWRLRGMGFKIRQEGKLFEIDGVPEHVCEHFSKRRAQIKQLVDKKMREMGLDPASVTASRGVFQVAALESRDQKNELTRAELQQLWNQAGEELGFTTEQVNALKGAERDLAELELTDDELKKEAHAAIDELTQTNAVFKEPALLTALAVRLTGRASPKKILRVVDFAKRNLYRTYPEDLTQVADDGSEKKKEADETNYIYTTKEMLLLEREMLMFANRRDKQHVLKDTTLPEKLTEEQREAAMHAMTDKNSVSVVEGTAGAGKTFTMAAVAEAYKRNGYRVTGLSNSWSAALNLKNEAELQDGRAITGWLNGVRNGKIRLDQKTCVILDEAGMSGAREMRDVLEECKNAGAKVILLGDTLQQKSVTCGDPLRIIAKQNGSKRLDEIRRQKDEDQRKAVHDFFAGRASAGIQTYLKNDRVKITSGEVETTALMIADWHTARKDGGSDLLIAVTKNEVRELNRLAHEKRKEAGELGESLQIKSMDSGKETLTEFSVGDEVVIRVTRTKEEIYNRERFQITGITGTILHLESKSGRIVDMDINDEEWQYKDDDEAAGLGLQHSYAITAYASQGLTVDRAFVKDSLYLKRSNAGVAMSRHRNECSVYVDRVMHYESVMSMASDEEWFSIDKFTDEACITSLTDKWSKEDVKHSTTDFNDWAVAGNTFNFRKEYDQYKREQAAAQAEKDIKRISAESKANRSQQKIKQLETRPFQQNDGYVLPEPAENHTAAKTTVQNFAKNFIKQDLVKEAYKQGAIRFNEHGLPVFCGRRDDGKLVNLVEIDSKPASVLRDQFPPVLAGSANSGFVHAVKKGIDALSLWALQDAKKIPRSTVIVTGGSDSALGLPHIRRLVESAKKFVRLDLREKDHELQELNLRAQKEAIDDKYYRNVPFAVDIGGGGSHSDHSAQGHQHYERQTN